MIKILPLAFALFCGSVSAAELTRYTSQKLHQAQKMDAEGELKRAIEILKPLDNLRRYDEAIVARSLGVYYWRSNQASKAVNELERALNTGSLSGDELYQVKMMLADLYFNQQQYLSSVTLYHSLVNQTTGESLNTLWLKMAKAHYQLEDWQKAINAAKSVKPSTTEQKIEVLTLMFASQIKLKWWSGAEVSLKSLLGHQPDNALWWRQLVSVQMRQNKPNAALASLGVAQQLVELTSQEQQTYLQLLSQQGAPERAASQLSQSESLTEEQWIQQAYLWQQAKEWDKAIEVWQQLARTDEQYYLNIAQIHYRQGEYQPALAALERIQLGQVEVWLLRAQVLYKLGRNSEALEFARKANAKKPSTETDSWLVFLTQVAEASRSQKHFE